MRVLCAWCLKEGKSRADALTGKKLGADIVSLGICPRHREAGMARVRAGRRRGRRAKMTRPR